MDERPPLEAAVSVDIEHAPVQPAAWSCARHDASCQVPLRPETMVQTVSKRAASRSLWEAEDGTERHTSYGSTVHRAGGPVPERQDDAARSNPRPHRRDP